MDAIDGPRTSAALSVGIVPNFVNGDIDGQIAPKRCAIAGSNMRQSLLEMMLAMPSWMLRGGASHVSLRPCPTSSSLYLEGGRVGREVGIEVGREREGRREGGTGREGGRGREGEGKREGEEGREGEMEGGGEGGSEGGMTKYGYVRIVERRRVNRGKYTTPLSLGLDKLCFFLNRLCFSVMLITCAFYAFKVNLLCSIMLQNFIR